MVDVRQKLAQPADGELERLLIQRVVLSYVAASFAETLRAQKWQEELTDSDATFWDRHVTSLHGDFLKACRALGDIRRLARPAVLAQMNIADKQQINVSLDGERALPDSAK